MLIVFQLGEYSLRNRILWRTHWQESDFLDMMSNIAQGLMAIHDRSLIHRDIKPENIIYSDGLYKITDFGSLEAGIVGESIIGTPLYLPPEMLFDQDSKYSQKIDVWSFGVSVFEAYFGIHPFFYLEKV